MNSTTTIISTIEAKYIAANQTVKKIMDEKSDQ